MALENLNFVQGGNYYGRQRFILQNMQMQIIIITAVLKNNSTTKKVYWITA